MYSPRLHESHPTDLPTGRHSPAPHHTRSHTHTQWEGGGGEQSERSADNRPKHRPDAIRPSEAKTKQRAIGPVKLPTACCQSVTAPTWLRGPVGANLPSSNTIAKPARMQGTNCPSSKVIARPAEDTTLTTPRRFLC